MSGRWSHRTYPVSVSPRSQRCKQTPVSTSQAQIMGRSFLSTGCLSHNFSNISSGSIGDIDGGSPSSWRRRKRQPWESIGGYGAVKEALASQFRGNPVQFPGALGLDIPFSSLYTPQIQKNMRIVGLKGLLICLILTGWCNSWRIARTVRTDRTFRGSRCRGGLGGRLHHICMERANMFPNFSSFPPDSVPHPGFWNIFFVFIFHHPKRVPAFQVPSVVKSIGNVKPKIHEVIGSM